MPRFVPYQARWALGTVLILSVAAQFRMLPIDSLLVIALWTVASVWLVITSRQWRLVAGCVVVASLLPLYHAILNVALAWACSQGNYV